MSPLHTCFPTAPGGPWSPGSPVMPGSPIDPIGPLGPGLPWHDHVRRLEKLVNVRKHN